jgi:hypothetical protein
MNLLKIITIHEAVKTVSRLFPHLITLGRVISLSQGHYLNTGQHKHRINTNTNQTSMPYVEFEPTIASERAKTVHALDRSVTVTGVLNNNIPKYLQALHVSDEVYNLSSSSNIYIHSFRFFRENMFLICI